MAKNLEPGFKIQGGDYTYEIESTLGQGGFGITYLTNATVVIGNVTAKIRFAVKEHFISADCERDSSTSSIIYSTPVSERVENSRRDFIAEAKRLQKIGAQHKNIVKVNEVFEANNTAYYVMEYLEGQSLKQYVDSRGPLSEQETLQIMRPVVDAVATLHANRMTHLDIKPENIMITHSDDGTIRPVLIDFGLSKHYGKDGLPTSTVNILGCSDGYAPIEQYAGITSFSPEADIYAIAMTLYFCLTGKTPKKAVDLREGEIASELATIASPALVDDIRRASLLMKANRESAVATLFQADTRTKPLPTSHPENNKTIPIDKSTEKNKKTDAKVTVPILPADPNISTPVAPPVPTDTKKKNKIITIAVLAAVAAIAFVCVFFLIRSEVKDKKQIDLWEDEYDDDSERSPLFKSLFDDDTDDGLITDPDATPDERMLLSIASDPDVLPSPDRLYFYKILYQADGPTPRDGDDVRFYFTCSLPDGTVIDDFTTPGEPVEMQLNSIIPGLANAITRMPEGSHWIIYLPSDQAYGQNGSGEIPPGQPLVFDVQLVGIN